MSPIIIRYYVTNIGVRRVDTGFIGSGHHLQRAVVPLAVGMIFALVTALLATSPSALAATDRIPLDIGSGTFYRTVYNAEGIRLQQPVDAFATNPFTSTPTRWDDGATLNLCYINNARLRIGDARTTDSCQFVNGATLCFDNDNAAGCGNVQATTDSTDPPQLAFETDVTLSEDAGTPASRMWYGFLNCPNYNALDACLSTPDSDTSINGGEMTRNFVGMRINKAAAAYYTFRAEIKYTDGAGSNGTFTNPVCTLNDLCKVTGSYQSSVGLTITVTAASGNVSSSVASSVGGKTLRLNHMGLYLATVTLDDPEYDFDNTAMSMRVSGNWQSVAVDTRAVMSAFEIAHVVAAARDLSNLAFIDGGVTEATYTPDITTGTSTTITEGQLSTGSFGTLGIAQVNVTLDGDRVWTSEVDSATLVLTVPDDGGGGDPIVTPIPPIVPQVVQLLIRKSLELCNLWLLVFLVLVMLTVVGIRRAKVRGPGVRP